MFDELKRHNYVTPTNYLELVSGYKILLAQKREEIGSQVKKLRNGLFKIDDTREKVEKMSIDLEEAKIKVAAFQKQCDEYLVTLVQQKKQADEQQKQVSATSEKIAQEEIKCKGKINNYKNVIFYLCNVSIFQANNKLVSTESLHYTI